MKALLGLAWGMLAGLGVALLGVAGQPLSAPDTAQDILFLGDSRPVLLRLYAHVEGRPFRDIWEEYLQKLFADLDTDGNGALSPAEAARVPSLEFLQALFQGELTGETAKATIPFVTLDADRDGRVTRPELGAYYRQAGRYVWELKGVLSADWDGGGRSRELSSQYLNEAKLDALVLQEVYHQIHSDRVPEALFSLLDRNRDGKLDAQELAKAATVLSQVDLDEDEFITPEELLRRRPAKAVAGKDSLSAVPPPQPSPSFWMVRAGERLAPLAQDILQHYDRDRDGRLSRAEIGLEPARFAALDADRNGSLDVDELTRFVTGQPDLELLVRVDHPPSPQRGNAESLPYAEVLHSTQRTLSLAQSVQQTTQKMLALSVDNAVMEWRVQPPTAGNFQSLRQFYLQRFQVADADRRGFLERRQVEPSSYLDGLFTLADRDGDGKLSSAELSAFLDLHAQGARSFTTLTVVDQSLALFELLDTDRDGRLSQRELSAAWTRLRNYDRNGDGAVSREELPRQYQLWLTRGWSKPNLQAPQPETARKDGVARGPLWFRKMDLNGDGEVSRREFLGSVEAFRRLDADGDGLISLEEAERADGTHPEKKGPRRRPDGH